MIPALVIALLVALAGNASASGITIFNARCAVCHQPKGTGIPGQYPPLADSVGNYVRIPKGREYLVHVVSFGMNGAISVHGAKYNGLMQQWTDLSNDDVAQVLNHVLTDFNSQLLPKDFAPFTADEVKRYRSAKLSFAEVHQERARLFGALSRGSVEVGKREWRGS